MKRAGGPAAALVDTLIGQHARGREINAFLVDRSKSGIIAADDSAAVAAALDGFARMYEKHSAIEDTVIFQAWRKSLSPEALKDAGEKFEDIDKAQLKGDGFDIAVDRIASIEQALGLADLGAFTAAAPPHIAA